MSLLDEVGPCKAVERDEEARLGHIREVKEREYFQKLRYELFTKQHFSLTRISTRLPMAILLYMFLTSAYTYCACSYFFVLACNANYSYSCHSTVGVGHTFANILSTSLRFYPRFDT